MPGNPQAKIKAIAALCEWHRELSTDFDKALPSIYRHSGQKPGQDRRANAWGNADKCIMLAGAALTELESVLRSHAITKAKPPGRPAKYVKVEHDEDAPDERIGTPMFVDE